MPFILQSASDQSEVLERPDIKRVRHSFQNPSLFIGDCETKNNNNNKTCTESTIASKNMWKPLSFILNSFHFRALCCFLFQLSEILEQAKRSSTSKRQTSRLSTSVEEKLNSGSL